MNVRCRKCGRPIPMDRWTSSDCDRCQKGGFALRNPDPKPKPAKFDNTKATQRKLLDGLDLLPGQQDLF